MILPDKMVCSGLIDYFVIAVFGADRVAVHQALKSTRHVQADGQDHDEGESDGQNRQRHSQPVGIGQFAPRNGPTAPPSAPTL